MERTINIRSIQHYMYCPRRYALLEVNDDWAENAFTVKADIMHENVHSGSHDFTSNCKIAKSAVSIYNDLPEYNLYGITDCIEFDKNNKGVLIPQFKDKYIIKIIEYKPKPPKSGEFHESDAIQVFAQKVCTDYVFGGSSEGYIYYSETRKRIKLPFDTEYEKYDTMLKDFLIKMREITKTDFIPPREKGQKCSGCSMSDVCFPKEKSYDVQKIIMQMSEENNL